MTERNPDDSLFCHIKFIIVKRNLRFKENAVY